MILRYSMWILWPSFLMASFLEMLVFGFLDPQDIHFLGLNQPEIRKTVCAISFFVFWAICACSSALTSLLSRSAHEVKQTR
jgi:hypothetical protein